MRLLFEPTFRGRAYLVYMIFRYSQYALILAMLILLFYFQNVFIFIVFFISFVLVCSLIFLESIKKKYSSSVSFLENEIVISIDTLITQLNNHQILRIKLFIESYKGRGSLFSFWKELGYNRLVITEKNGLKHYFLFQIQGKQNFDRLLKDIKLIENYYPYNVSITKILT